MAEKKKIVSEHERKSVIEQLWLHYYNDTLHNKGMISDHDYRRMKTKINSRKPSSLER